MRRLLRPILTGIAASGFAFLAGAATAHAQESCGTATNSCFEVNLKSPGCDAAECCQTVCIIEPFCCETAWDDLCVALAQKFCSPCGTSNNKCLVPTTTPGCEEANCCGYVCSLPGMEYCCEIAWDSACAAQAKDGCIGCGAPGASPCGKVHAMPGCNDADCCAQVCVVDPQCCTLTWDETCVQWSEIFCPSCGGPTAGNCCFAHDTPYCNDSACCEAVCGLDPYCCDVRWDKTCVTSANVVCDLANCLCGDASAGSCKVPHPNPGCSDFDCCNDVCGADPFCCLVTWDYACTRVTEQLCATIAICGQIGTGSCFIRHSNPGCDEAGCCQTVCVADPLCCEITWDDDCVDLAETTCTDCGDILAGSCFSIHGNPACADGDCCEAVCKADPVCCQSTWDGVCVTLAEALCDNPIAACATNLSRSCYLPAYLPGCDDPGCCFTVCTTVDPFCCEVRWDAVCVEIAYSYCGGIAGCPSRYSCVIPHANGGCNDPICCAAVCETDPICCALGWDQHCANIAKELCFGLDACPGDKPCNRSHGSPGCEDPACCNVVCAVDPLCCIEAWDAGCVQVAKARCQPESDSNCPCNGSCLESHSNPGCSDPSCCAGVCVIDPACCTTTWDDACVGIARGTCCGDVGCGNWCAGSCFEPHGAPFCSDAACCEAVCSIDPFCCSTKWDGLCADFASVRCAMLCGVPGSGGCFKSKDTPGCEDRECCDAVCNSDPFCCQNSWDENCVLIAKGDPGDPTADPPVPPTKGVCTLPKCGDFSAGRCCEAHATPACDNNACCDAVCAKDPFCCDTEWDDSCAGTARENPICNCVSECGDTCAGSCCEPHATPLCDDSKCCTAVCAVDPFCCELAGGAWDNICVGIALGEAACEDPCPSPPCGDLAAGDCCTPHLNANCADLNCCNDVCSQDPFCCDSQWDFTCAVEAGVLCDICQAEIFCGSPAAGSCYKPHSAPYCDDLSCCGLICTIDETCCLNEWDQACADLALSFCAP